MRTSFPDQDPIGRRIRCGLDTLEYMTIVGVVADVRTAGPARNPQPESRGSRMLLVGHVDPLSLAATMTRMIRDRNPDVPVRATTMEGAKIAEQVAIERGRARCVLERSDRHGRAQHQQPLRDETHLNRGELDETPAEKSGAKYQHHRQRDLRDDERAARPSAARAD